MKRNFLTLALLLGVALSMQARQRTVAEMKSAAFSVIGRNVSGKPSAPANVQALQVLGQNSQLTVLGTQTGGFAVIANDDSFSAVLGYSDNQYSSNPAPAFVWWMNAMNESLEKALANGESVEPVKRDAAYKTSVPALLTSIWGQGEPYNNMTPVYPGDNGDEHYVVGCVATAMAQVMRYHKYPEVGEGSRSYRFAPGGGVSAVTLKANFGETHYDWDNMLDSYPEGSYTDTEADAAALISSHCGIAVKMTYTKDGSGSYSEEALKALRSYFRYNPNIKYFNRDYYPKDEWMNLVYRELSDGCPIIYGGQSTSGGHCFVLDGYNAQGLVHVNWGWNGQMDGYFDIGSLNGYSTNQTLVQARLLNDSNFPDTYYSIWGLPQKVEASKTAAGVVTIKSQQAYQMDVDPFTGGIYVIAINQETGTVYPVAVASSNISNMKFGYGVSLSGGASFDATTLPNGTYRICFASKSVNESSYRAIRSKESVRNSYTLTVGETITLTPDRDSNWTATVTGIESVSDNVNAASDGIVRVFDTTGRLVYHASKSLFNVNDIPAKGILVVKDGTEVKKILK